MNIQRKRDRSPDGIVDRPSSCKRPQHAAPPQEVDRAVTHRLGAASGVAGATFGASALTAPQQGPPQALPPEVPPQRPLGAVYGVPVVCLDWDQVRGNFVWDDTYRNLGVDDTTLGN